MRKLKEKPLKKNFPTTPSIVPSQKPTSSGIPTTQKTPLKSMAQPPIQKPNAPLSQT
jgi:hypothetical protein